MGFILGRIEDTLTYSFSLMRIQAYFMQICSQRLIILRWECSGFLKSSRFIKSCMAIFSQRAMILYWYIQKEQIHLNLYTKYFSYTNVHHHRGGFFQAGWRSKQTIRLECSCQRVFVWENHLWHVKIKASSEFNYASKNYIIMLFGPPCRGLMMILSYV